MDMYREVRRALTLQTALTRAIIDAVRTESNLTPGDLAARVRLRVPGATAEAIDQAAAALIAAGEIVTAEIGGRKVYDRPAAFPRTYRLHWRATDADLRAR